MLLNVTQMWECSLYFCILSLCCVHSLSHLVKTPFIVEETSRVVVWVDVEHRCEFQPPQNLPMWSGDGCQVDGLPRGWWWFHSQHVELTTSTEDCWNFSWLSMWMCVHRRHRCGEVEDHRFSTKVCRLGRAVTRRGHILMLCCGRVWRQLLLCAL